MLSSDWKAQHNDTLLYPGKMTEQQLQKLPPTVMITSEYDIFRREAYDFAEKLKRVSKLLDFSDYASVGHTWDIISPTSPVNEQVMKDLGALLFDNLIK